MIERIRKLGIFQKIILAFLLFILVLFYIIYAVAIKKVGFEYQNVILKQTQESAFTVYSGKIEGKQAEFIVSDNKTVEFRYGDQIYGPYVAKENPDVIPEDHALSEDMTGVEIYAGNQLFFSGGVMKSGEEYWIFNGDGGFEGIDISIGTFGGVETDLDGNVIDPIEPTVSDLIELMDEPKLTHKGDWLTWFQGLCICVITALSILYADELFRWDLSFKIRNVEQAEPSEWEMTSRYIGWALLSVLAVILFVIGLQ